MRLKSNIAVMLCLLASLHAGTRAQDKSKAIKPFEFRTNLLVLDEKNNHVDGIKQSDVKLFENGVEQKLTYFATKDRSLDVCLVVDNSGSVQPQLEAVMNIAKLITANLGPADSEQVVRFIGRDNISVIQDWTKDKAALNDAVDSFYTEGGLSAVIDALYLAGQDILKRRKAAPNKRYAIVLISDGEERASYYNQKQLIELLSGTDVQVFTVGLLRDLPRRANEPRKTAAYVTKMVEKLAAETGGTSFTLDQRAKEADYRNALKSLIYELRSQIVVGYIPANPKIDPIRKLTVTIADGPKAEKRKAISKENIVLAQD